jgi:membrane protein required for colicin V production
MPLVDFIFLSLTIFSSLIGLSRGFVKEFLSLTKWLLSLYIAFVSFEKTKIILSNFLKDSEILDLIAAISTFLLIFLILSLIFNFVSKFLSLKGIGFIDKSLGFLFGSLRMILIFSLIFIIYTDIFYNQEKPTWFNDSYSIEYIDKLSVYLKKKFLEFNLNNDIIT